MKSRSVALIILGAPLLLFLLSGVRAVQLAREGDVPESFRDLDCDSGPRYGTRPSIPSGTSLETSVTADWK